MKARALVLGTMIGAFFAGCGITAVGSHDDPPAADAGRDETGARLTEASAIDSTPLGVPAQNPTETPIADLDAGSDADADTDADTLDAGTDGTVALASFEILAPPGGTYHMVTPGAVLPCSTGGVIEASFDVLDLSSQKVSINWIDYQCSERYYGAVSAGTQRSQPTYIGHRWRIRNVSDAGILGDFVIDGPGNYTVIVR